MKFASVLLFASCTLMPAVSHAQFVPGNLAVSRTSGQVTTPPLPASTGKACSASAKCHAGAWHMVETADGLVECTEPYARPSTCRASSYGRDKLPRLWIVKTPAAWRWCQYPDLGSKCTDLFARPPANLPFDAVQ